MELNKAAREFYTLELSATDVAGGDIADVGTFQASFDQGQSWVDGEQMSGTGWWQWLVAGPLVDAAADPLPDGVALAASLTDIETQPWIRLKDTPELVVKDDAPPIHLSPR